MKSRPGSQLVPQGRISHSVKGLVVIVDFYVVCTDIMQHMPCVECVLCCEVLVMSWLCRKRITFRAQCSSCLFRADAEYLRVMCHEHI